MYEVIKRTEQLVRVTFLPHDAQRTFITEALVIGTPLADVQAQAGHKQASTMLHYAQPVETKHRRERLRLAVWELKVPMTRPRQNAS